MLAKDLMTLSPTSVTSDTTVRKVIQLMLDKDISGVPVLDTNGSICGMITEGDLLRKNVFDIGGRHSPKRPDETFFAEYVRSHGTTVADCMVSEVVCVSPDQQVGELVSLMRSRNIRRLPVVDAGRLVGIVSRRDVLKAISTVRDAVAEGEDELQLAVATRLHDELGLAPDELPLRVYGSIVEVLESAEEPAKRRAIQLVAESVAGVAGVVFRPNLHVRG